tara:strand:+ start:222 stop:554 length:333 start_codon:yes stop_codon:yes gene_type:complete
MDPMDMMIIIPILFLLFLSITLGIYIYSNRQLLRELKEDSDDNETKMKNIINAVNYNDAKLMENQKYLYDVYEENNNFQNMNDENDTSIDNSDQYYNMMKNYDALIRLTK